MIFHRTQNGITPLVSVVVCTYNRENYIRQTIDSILQQKRDFPIEILIGDDASSDETREILKKYKADFPEIISLVLHEENQGVGKNWAGLMKLVNGKYVALCDDDDYWHYEEKLQKQIQILEQNEEIGLVYTNFRENNTLKKTFKEHKINNSAKKPVFNALFDGEYFILSSSVVLRTGVLNQYVNLDDYIKYAFPIQDWVTWIQIAKYVQFYHLKLSTVTYRVSNNSITRPVDNEQLHEKFDKENSMYRYICDKFNNDVVYDEKRWNDFVNRAFLALSYNINDFQKAHYYAGKIQKKTVRAFCTKNKYLFNLYRFMMKNKSRF